MTQEERDISGNSITTCTGLTPPTEEERPLKSYMRNSKAKLMDLEVRPNNDLKYQRNFCQAIFGLLQSKFWILTVYPQVQLLRRLLLLK